MNMNLETAGARARLANAPLAPNRAAIGKGICRVSRFRTKRWVLVIAGLFWLQALADIRPPGGPEAMGWEEEETFELRMERVLKQAGHEALVQRLQKELAENYRPYAAAWLANYQLYGELFGLPNIHDEKAGLALAKKAMSEGSIFGKELVGRALVDGRGCDQRMPREGAVLLKEAAEAGRYTAMGELAKLYLHGYGVTRNLVLAELWARRAAYRGAPIMLRYFGEWMENGKSGWPVNATMACRYYLEAAEWGEKPARRRLEALDKAGSEEARLSLQLLLLFDLSVGGDFTTVRIKRAVQMLEAQRPDDPLVQVTVGQIRMERALPVYDPVKAWAQMEEAAQSGNDDGRYFQAEMTRRGIGRKKDVAAAVAQIQSLADKGNARAMGRMGWLYYWGADEKGTKNADRAFTYVRRAAQAGDVLSILNAGFMYEQGLGTPVNYYMSARYYSIAEDLGYVEATRKKDAALAAIKD